MRKIAIPTGYLIVIPNIFYKEDSNKAKGAD